MAKIYKDTSRSVKSKFFNKKFFLPVVATLLVVICAIIGLSYAYWRITYKQNDFNTLGVRCFDVTLTNEENDIQLESASPITDEEGMELIPYTFTITNTCDTYAHYEVNLEDIYSSDIEKRLSYQYIKASLDGGTPQNLKNYQEVEPTLPNADRSFKLTSGTLAPTGSEGDQKTYELRLWMDYDTPPLPETMNAIFQSKISIVASYVEEETLQNNIVLSYESKTEGYSKVSETVEIQGASENYNIIEISEDGVTFTPVSPSKEIRVTKEYTKESNPTFYVRDEVGNIKKIDIVLEHLDQSGPEIIATPQEEWGTTNTISIELKDEKSGLSGYQITMTEEEPSEWKEVSGNTTTVEEVVNENKTYYIWSKDVLGNIHHTSVTVNHIDENGPIVEIGTTTGNGVITIDASGSYDNETSIKTYEYKLDDGNYYPSETSSYTFTGVSHGTHTITVRITDIGGNETIKSVSVNVVVTYTVTFNANGGSGAPSSQTKTHGTNLTLSSTRPTRTGYTFLGWSTSSGATSATYSAGGTFDLNADTTLYAVWRANTYTITYNANGGSGAPAAQSYTYATSGTINLSSTRPTRSGYTFLGWSLSSTATSPSYSAGQAWSRSNASNYTLYAVWRVNVIRAFTFNKDSNKCASVDQVYNEGYVRFSDSGYVGSYMSIGYESHGWGIRLIPSKSGTLRFHLTVTNETGAGLTSNCDIWTDDNLRYSYKISQNTTQSFTVDISVTSGQIINIGNDGQNGYMYVRAGSYIEWIN